MFGQWLADTFGETSYGWQRVRSPTSISIGIEHPGGERSFLTAAGNLAEQTAADILGMMPARAQPGDIALLTGAFLYPALLDSFDMVLDLIGKRGFAVALDTGWPPDGWDAADAEPRRRHGCRIATTSCSTKSNASRCRARTRSKPPPAGWSTAPSPARSWS